MEYCCYILYSPTLNKFYVGETENFEIRLNQHNSGFLKNSYTSQVSDWEAYFIIPCRDRVQARKIESFIKRMKSTAFIKKIKENPEIIQNIVERDSKSG